MTTCAPRPSGLPEPDHPDAPRYWRAETSGRLAAAVHSYYADPDAMTRTELAYFRAYISQWILSPVWDLNPSLDDAGRERLNALRAASGAISTAADLRAWLRAAREEALDPM